MTRTYKEARDAVFQELFDIATKDPNVILITADTGAFLFSDFRKHLSGQFFNIGIAEQNAISVAAGLALTGKKVFVFGISNFVTLRCFEQIKIDVCCHCLPVTIIGMGSGYVYPKDGPTHHMTDIISLTRTLPGITVWSPSDYVLIARCTRIAYESNSPAYIYIDKGPFENIYEPQADFSIGFNVLKEGDDITIVATGIMVPQALRVRRKLQEMELHAGIIDLYRIKPINSDLLLKALSASKHIITLEENTVIGGLGSLICELVAESDLKAKVKRYGIPDAFRCQIGDRDTLRALDGLDEEGICKSVRDWISS